MKKKEKHSLYSTMEDVDRSCVHVVIVIGLIFAALACVIFPRGISGVPFTALTGRQVFRLTASAIPGMLAILIFIDVMKVFIRR